MGVSLENIRWCALNNCNQNCWKGFLILVLTLFAWSVSLPVLAAESSKSAVTHIDKHHKERVEQMLVLMGVPAQVNAAADNFKQIYSAKVDASQSDQNVVKVINAYQQDLGRLVDSVLGWDAIKQNYINVYARNLTPREVVYISAFLKSPSGVKFVSSQSAASQELINITEHLVEADLALPLKNLSIKLGDALTKLKVLTATPAN